MRCGIIRGGLVITGFVGVLRLIQPAAPGTGDRRPSRAEVFSSPSVRDMRPRASSVPPRLGVEFGGCAVVRGQPGENIECLYTPGESLTLWIDHNLDVEPSVVAIGDVRWEIVEQFQHLDESGKGYEVRLDGDGFRSIAVDGGGLKWQLPLRSIDRLTGKERQSRSDLVARWKAIETRLAKQSDTTTIPLVERLVKEAIASGWLSDAVKVGFAASYRVEALGEPDRGEAIINGVLEAAYRYPRGRAIAEIYRGNIREAQGHLSAAARAYRDGARFAVRMDDIGLQLDALPRYAMALARLGYYEAAAYWGTEARAVIPRGHRPIDRAMALELVAQTFLRLQRMHEVHDEPTTYFEQVLEMYAPGGPTASSREPVGVRLGLAEISLHAGNPAGVERWLKTIDLARANLGEQVRAQELRLRSLLSGSQAADSSELRAALSSFDSLSRRLPGPELRWRSALARGIVHERLGQRDEARVAFEESEDHLDDVLSSMALGKHVGLGVGYYEQGTQRLLSLLVEAGELHAAVCVTRQFRARANRVALFRHRVLSGQLQPLQELFEQYQLKRKVLDALLDDRSVVPGRERARLDGEIKRLRQEIESLAEQMLSSEEGKVDRPTCDELSPRKPGELLLVLFPHGEDLRVFVVDDDGTTQTRLAAYTHHAGLLDERWLAGLLLTPEADRIAKASRVRVLAWGDASSIAVHALPWPGAGGQESMLGLEIPVVYSMELLAEDRAVDAQVRHALVVADSWAEGAPEEIDTIHRLLAAQDYTVAHSLAQATSRRELLNEFGSTQLFHFAGHSYFSEVATDVASWVEVDDRQWRWPPYSGGAAAMPSFIPLGDNSGLTVPDILTSTRVPQTVVLMGCATAVIDERQSEGGLSLATAFLAAGASVVVGSTRKIASHDAALLGRSLYSPAAGGPSMSVSEPGRWMADGFTAALNEGLPPSSVASYRILVP